MVPSSSTPMSRIPPSEFAKADMSWARSALGSIDRLNSTVEDSPPLMMDSIPLGVVSIICSALAQAANLQITYSLTYPGPDNVPRPHRTCSPNLISLLHLRSVPPPPPGRQTEPWVP